MAVASYTELPVILLNVEIQTEKSFF